MALITLKAKEIKERISVGVFNHMANEAFIFKKTKNEFVRQNSDFTSIFNLQQLSWSSSVSIDVRLYISQKQIESILEKIIGKQRYKITIWQELGRIFKSPDGRKVINGDLSIWLYNDEDVEAAIETLIRYIDTIALPYFDRYSNLESIDDIINNPPFDHNPAHVGGMFNDRCMKGLIVARLVSNPNYEKLVEIYDEQIKGTMSSEMIENYYQVRDYLLHHRITN